MPSRFERYRVVDGKTPLAARYFNPVFQDLDLRLASLEEVRISWDTAVKEVVKFGLTRIDELITEPLREVSQLSNQAHETSAQLEQLRQTAQTHTADLTALINTLRNQTEQQVDAFVASTTQDAANDLAAWKALRTAELDTWVESFDASIEAAQQELQGDMAALQMGIKRLRTTRNANTKMVQADSCKLVDIVGGSFTQTFDEAATLGNGWWCYLRNSGDGDITLAPAGAELIDGVSGYVLYPGECRLIQCDGATLRTLIVTPFCLTRRSSFDFRKPPGYQAFKLDIRGATGGGGGGGSGARVSGASYGGGGGGSSSPGGRCWAEFPATLVSELTPFTVGAGGAGGASVTTPTDGGQNGLIGSTGASGGTTSVVIDICSISVPGSAGGKPGYPGTTSSAGIGGAAGAAPTPTASITLTNSGTALSRYGLQAHSNGTGAAGGSGETSAAGNPNPAPGGAGGISPWPASSAGPGGNGGNGGPGVKNYTDTSVGQPGGDGVNGMVIIKGVL